jgi:hypothetical protein
MGEQLAKEEEQWSGGGRRGGGSQTEQKRASGKDYESTAAVAPAPALSALGEAPPPGVGECCDDGDTPALPRLNWKRIDFKRIWINHLCCKIFLSFNLKFSKNCFDNC